MRLLGPMKPETQKIFNYNLKTLMILPLKQFVR